MAVTRVTQNMLTQASLDGLQSGLSRLARIQEQLTTGKTINRPSDDPSGAASTMRLRASLADQRQYVRNAADGQAWLTQVDTALGSMAAQVQRARDLALQGANAGTGADSRTALAVEVEQLRESLIAGANTQYLGRPVFGGVTGGSTAYDDTGTYVGVPGAVTRTVADGVKVRIDVDGPAAFGPAGSTVFDHLADLATALRSNDQAAISGAIDVLEADRATITSARSDAGTRMSRLEQAATAAGDVELTLTTRLSELEDTDLPKAMVDLKTQEVAYQAALAATARVMQPSLLDFLR